MLYNNQVIDLSPNSSSEQRLRKQRTSNSNKLQRENDKTKMQLEKKSFEIITKDISYPQKVLGPFADEIILDGLDRFCSIFKDKSAKHSNSEVSATYSNIESLIGNTNSKNYSSPALSLVTPNADEEIKMNSETSIKLSSVKSNILHSNNEKESLLNDGEIKRNLNLLDYQSKQPKITPFRKRQNKRKPKLIKIQWALTRINVFDDHSRTFEIMKPLYRNPLRQCPNSTVLVFALLPDGTCLCYNRIPKEIR